MLSGLIMIAEEVQFLDLFFLFVRSNRIFIFIYMIYISVSAVYLDRGKRKSSFYSLS